MPEAFSGLVELLEQGCRGSSSFACLFEGIKFSVKFGEHLFSREAFAAVELCKPFGNFETQLLAPYLIELLALFEQQKRLSNDLTHRAIAAALHSGSDELLQFWWEYDIHETRTPLV
jgi:hypothetical protein